MRGNSLEKSRRAVNWFELGSASSRARITLSFMRAHAIRGNTQWLDGGSMFGNVPRALWSRWCPPDELGRIELACRSLLIEDGEQKVLLEAGIGAFFEPKLKDRFGVVEDEHVLLASLGQLGLTDADIDVVVLSHLHFDHAGGLLAPWGADEAPRLLFPNAKFVVGKTALERAKDPHPRDRASFIPELVPLLEASGRLTVLDASHCDVLPSACSFRQTFGHTPGMLHTTVRGATQSVFFCADLVPGAPWVHLPITMGYDRYPEKLIDEKAEVFDSLDSDTWLFFTHDASVSAAKISRDSKGRYRATDTRPDFGSGLEL